jgi:hypothetical protein
MQSTLRPDLFLRHDESDDYSALMLRFRCDPWLGAILIAAALFCAYGIHWGRAEDWNYDEVALRPLNGLHPGVFYKPPFHTYVNHLLVFYPVHLAERLVKQTYLHRPVRFNEARLIGSRLLTAVLFLGTIAFIFAIALQCYGRFAARIIAVIFATSAGFIAFAHFLTCDLPLLFWMAAAAFFSARIAQSGKTRDYVLAGVFAGLAAATKYNGVLVGGAIAVGHLFSPNCRDLRSVFHWRLFLAGALIPLAFIAGNPYAVLDYKKFSADFMYTYTVTPRYGVEERLGYGEFLRTLPEIVGMPGTILIALFVAASLLVLIQKRDETRNARIGFLIAASVAVVYYLSVGSFARVPTRFALPAIPFLVLMMGPVLAFVETRTRVLVLLLLVPVIAYNVICSLFVGKRFCDDPRLSAQDWMIAHARGKTIQSSYVSPHWTKLYRLRGVEFWADQPPQEPPPPNSTIDWRMPVANGRMDVFKKDYAGNRWVEQGVWVEGRPEQTVFSSAGQAQRNPDLISIYSPDLDVPVEFVRNYYNDLLSEKAGYKTVFHGSTAAVSPLLYPKFIDCLPGTITILGR